MKAFFNLAVKQLFIAQKIEDDAIRYYKKLRKTSHYLATPALLI